MTASIEVALDTRPPSLAVEAASRVEPPDEWSMAVTADEDIGSASVALLDATGVLSSPGYSRVGPRQLLLTLPTSGMVSGPSTVSLRVADEVGNATQRTVSVLVVRPRAYDVVLTLTGAYETDLTVSEAYETTLILGNAHTVSLEF